MGHYFMNMRHPNFDVCCCGHLIYWETLACSHLKVLHLIGGILAWKCACTSVNDSDRVYVVIEQTALQKYVSLMLCDHVHSGHISCQHEMHPAA